MKLEFRSGKLVVVRPKWKECEMGLVTGKHKGRCLLETRNVNWKL